MGRKADKRAARLASALEREWWALAAQCWVHVGEAIRWQTDQVYRAEVRARTAPPPQPSAGITTNPSLGLSLGSMITVLGLGIVAPLGSPGVEDGERVKDSTTNDVPTMYQR